MDFVRFHGSISAYRRCLSDRLDPISGIPNLDEAPIRPIAHLGSVSRPSVAVLPPSRLPLLKRWS